MWREPQWVTNPQTCVRETEITMQETEGSRDDDMHHTPKECLTFKSIPGNSLF